MAEKQPDDATPTEPSETDGGSLPEERRVPRGTGQPASREPKKWGRCAGGVPPRPVKSQHSPENAARERSRVRNLRQAFHSLQAALPSVPPDTKLSKLDVLVLATNYIAHLTHTLDHGSPDAERVQPHRAGGFLHPVKKWPMRSLLYCGSVEELLSGVPANRTVLSEEDDAHLLTPEPPGHAD